MSKSASLKRNSLRMIVHVEENSGSSALEHRQEAATLCPERAARAAPASPSALTVLIQIRN